MNERWAAKITNRILQVGMRAPDRVMLMVLGLVERAIRTSGYQKAIRHIRKRLREDHGSIRAVRRLVRELDGPVMETLVRNFLVQHLLTGYRRRLAFKKAYGYASPPFMILSPTMRCNLHCVGCWANDYAREPELDEATIERIVAECEAIGTTIVVLAGGEPFVMWDRIRPVLARHPRQIFQIFTNGTLVDERVADELKELRNVYLCFSIDGDPATNDRRRGAGVYEKLVRSMKLLRERGLLFSFSATVCRDNFDAVLCDAFVERMIEFGCLYGYFFTYMPVGVCPEAGMLLTPEQRVEARERATALRRRHPILMGDVWHEIEFFEGCVAGGRKFVHINNRGDVEACVFAHFASDNIHETTLAEALGSPFFRAVRRAITEGGDTGCRCLILEKNKELAALTQLPGVYATHPRADTVVKEFSDRFVEDHEEEERLRRQRPAEEADVRQARATAR
jgi:MoaA/NifB/PqqE/SkfB family radical SAM enzyme